MKGLEAQRIILLAGRPRPAPAFPRARRRRSRRFPANGDAEQWCQTREGWIHPKTAELGAIQNSNTPPTSLSRRPHVSQGAARDDEVKFGFIEGFAQPVLCISLPREGKTAETTEHFEISALRAFVWADSGCERLEAPDKARQSAV